MTHMARLRDGKHLAPGDMAGSKYGQIRRKLDMAGANENDLSRLALQVYMLRREYPVVDFYACRDLRSFQQTFYVHLGVLPAVKSLANFWCAHKTGPHICGARHCEAWSGSCEGFPVPDGILLH